MTFNYINSAADTNVPKEYLRAPDPQLLPPRVGHNWNDQAFRASQKKPQQLEAEFRGKRYFTSEGNFENPPPGQLGQTAAQLLASLSVKNRSRVAKKEEPPFMTLEDKVLNFSAFFCEKAPEGGTSDMWQRRVVIYLYPADNTVLIQERHVPNSGLDGGTFLKRQKVPADARQRELFPEDEYLTVNLFNVGEWVRINAVEFFLYDCDAFTREFLTMLGVDVGPSVEPPDDAFFLSKRNATFTTRDAEDGPENAVTEAERTARFVQDSGKLLRFYALLDERGGAKACVRKLEVLLYVEDDTIAVVERQNSPEAIPTLFLSRTFLPKCGSVEKQNELTFRHRINGQREPYIGPDAFYKDVDLSVGMRLNVLGRSVLLYDCDDFTREFYVERYGFEQPPATDVSEYFAPTDKEKMLTEARETSRAQALLLTGKGQGKNMAFTAKDVLRFRLRLSNPSNHENARRRFVLTYYTGADEGMLYEVAVPNVNYPAGCLLKRQPLAKPSAQGSLRTTLGAATNSNNQQLMKEVDRYHESDIAVGKEMQIAGLLLIIVGMDAHTEAYYLGNPTALPSEDVIKRLLAALLDFCYSRYGTAVKTFLAMDGDKDGVVGVDEFTAVVKQFQITDDALVAHVLFEHIASAPDTAFLTTEDVMKWMGDEKSEGLRRQKAEATLGTNGEEQQEHIKTRGLRTNALLLLRERLEARRIHSVDMFRMASTMPRAYRGKRATIHSLTNAAKDAVITPVQLRRCLDEILGGYPSDEQVSYILGFFFPDMPADQHLRQQDTTLDFSVDLPVFQAKFNEIIKLTMLPE
ncbi:EF-hand domain-containing family member C2 [Strigomonas culicis]|uniref:EF-hand domain-containing family member C2 n=1 Tax=Strigomonas culicis TaxID=28005 RepID=S9VM63_9TRYP|nr:EF-hand domain-containing family member C2 [Strigomonas culicis]EPY32074.1 EF-hand domain-containing family member C2 [Strigomonas culicis]|eukprot:EPY24300.1 EF-hand domain-containing family member C2 [Strigomonas culicis]